MDERLKQIANHYGIENQLNQLVEEMAELTVAVSKYSRDENEDIETVANLAEEIADAEIMLEQIKYLLNLDTMVACWKDTKIQRQLIRMRDVEQYTTDKDTFIEKLTETGGTNASDDFSKGWDAAVEYVIDLMDRKCYE